MTTGFGKQRPNIKQRAIYYHCRRSLRGGLTASQINTGLGQSCHKYIYLESKPHRKLATLSITVQVLNAITVTDHISRSSSPNTRVVLQQKLVLRKNSQTFACRPVSYPAYFAAN